MIYKKNNQFKSGENNIMESKFCTACGASMVQKIPDDDEHVRYVCTGCGRVHYNNPKMVVGCIPEQNGRILLCKRNIEPQKDKWTLPAGYLENGESVQEGALRETLEETRALVQIIAPYRLFNIVFVNQIYLMFRADLMSDKFGPTKESTDVRLFKQKDIPWDNIAFKVITLTLEHYLKDNKKKQFPFKIIDLR